MPAGSDPQAATLRGNFPRKATGDFSNQRLVLLEQLGAEARVEARGFFERALRVARKDARGAGRRPWPPERCSGAVRGVRRDRRVPACRARRPTRGEPLAEFMARGATRHASHG